MTLRRGYRNEEPFGNVSKRERIQGVRLKDTPFDKLRALFGMICRSILKFATVELTRLNLILQISCFFCIHSKLFFIF